MPAGFRSFGQLLRASKTSCEISMLIGQTCWQRRHMVQHQTQGVADSVSFMPSMAMRMKRARVHVFDAGGGTAGRAEPAGQAGIEAGSLREQFQRLLLEIDDRHGGDRFCGHCRSLQLFLQSSSRCRTSWTER